MDSPPAVPARIAATEDRGASVRILTLAPEAPFPYRAGQFLRVHANGHEPRSFSIASRPEKDGHVTLHVRNFGSGLSAYLAEVKLGEKLYIEGPFGSMDIAHARAKPVLMVAGGTGIAPLLAMMQELLRTGITEEGITLIYGARSAGDVYCRPELEALLSSGEITMIEAIGNDTPDRVLAAGLEDLSQHVVYLSGPAPMVEAVKPILYMRGAQNSRIFSDDWSKVTS